MIRQKSEGLLLLVLAVFSLTGFFSCSGYEFEDNIAVVLDSVKSQVIVYRPIYKEKPATVTILVRDTVRLEQKYPEVQLRYRTQRYEDSEDYKKLKKPRVWVKEVYGPGFLRELGRGSLGYGDLSSAHFRSSQNRNITSRAIYSAPIPHLDKNISGPIYFRGEEEYHIDYKAQEGREIYIRLGYEGIGHPHTLGSVLFTEDPYTTYSIGGSTFRIHTQISGKFMRRGVVPQDSVFPPPGPGYVSFIDNMHNNRLNSHPDYGHIIPFLDRFFYHRGETSFIESRTDRNPELLEGDFSLQYAYIPSNAPQLQPVFFSYASEGELLVRAVFSFERSGFYPEYMETLQQSTAPLTTPSEDLFDGETPIPYYTGKRYYEEGKRWSQLKNQLYTYPLLNQAYCCLSNGHISTPVIPPEKVSTVEQYGMVTGLEFFPSSDFDFNWDASRANIEIGYFTLGVYNGALDRSFGDGAYDLPNYEQPVYPMFQWDVGLHRNLQTIGRRAYQSTSLRFHFK